MSIQQQWKDTTRILLTDKLSEELYEEIKVAYNEPHRKHHTLKHIEYMLRRNHELFFDLGVAFNLDVIRLATFYHDFYYDTQRTDNEDRSADKCLALLEYSTTNSTNYIIKQAAKLIRYSNEHELGDIAYQPKQDQLDAKAFFDSDLQILGTDWATYSRYVWAIRKEYSWVPRPMYIAGRKKILETFLKRDRIFWFDTAAEDRARQNIKNELFKLAVHESNL